MRKWLIRIAILAAIIAAVLIARATVFAPEPVPVRVHEMQTGIVEETVTNSRAGTVRARRRAKLSPEVGGQVTAIPYREGESVRAGEIVLQLEDSAQRARLQLAQRDIDAARAEQQRACLAAERARRELERVAKLAAENIISVDLLDKTESAAASAGAACTAATAQSARAVAAVNLARTDLAKTVLRAPFDGLVAEVSAEVGEWTTPSPPGLPIPPIMDILDPGSIYISAPMDEVDSARIQTGQKARVTVDSHRGTEVDGTVTRIAPYVLDLEAQNRTVEVEVELTESEFAAALLPGTSADIEVILQVRDEVLRIPTAALMENNKALVFADGRLDQRDVEVGLRNWNFTEVVGGLSAGERVVISLDSPEIQDGAEAALAEEDETAP